MANLSALELIELRKHLLVARSEIQRQTFTLEVARIRKATAWVSTAAPWLMLLAPIAGIFLGRKRHSLRSLGAKAMWLWRMSGWIRRLLK